MAHFIKNSKTFGTHVQGISIIFQQRERERENGDATFQQKLSTKVLFTHNQCDQNGPFCKFLVTKLLTKVFQLFCDVFGYFELCHFLSKNCCDYFWASFIKIGLLFIPTSGHPAPTYLIKKPRSTQKTLNGAKVESCKY